MKLHENLQTKWYVKLKFSVEISMRLYKIVKWWRCHRDMCFPGMRVSCTHIPRDACFPTHISLGMHVSPTHISLKQ